MELSEKPLTLVLDEGMMVASRGSGPESTIAIRVTQDPICRSWYDDFCKPWFQLPPIWPEDRLPLALQISRTV